MILMSIKLIVSTRWISLGITKMLEQTNVLTKSAVPCALFSSCVSQNRKAWGSK